ncbi:MAG: hypothetical protein JOY96_00020, partial [Verrucomicrobia bacterium]|nr:hypothetical protein [Verrucomicrobiota bacterium]
MEASVSLERIQRVKERFPAEGLFAQKEWLLSPEPFFISPDFANELERLGHWLLKFVKATNQLYQLSVKRKQPEWVADYLDIGKPQQLIELGRRNFHDVPHVIRPDLILTDSGYIISELDSVPGGIGLTGWLNETYRDLGFDVVGGADGMIEGFRSILPKGAIILSKESATYRPEMDWIRNRMIEKY